MGDAGQRAHAPTSSSPVQPTQAGPQSRAQPDSAEAVLSRREAERGEKHSLLEQTKDFAFFGFEILDKAAYEAFRELDVVDVPKTDLTKELVGYAAGALLGAGSGAVATFLFATFGKMIADKAGQLASSLISGAYKKSLEKDHAKAVVSHQDLRLAFHQSYDLQRLEAKKDFITQWPSIRASLDLLGADQLAKLNAHTASKETAAAYTEMRRQTFVAWTNFLARAKHGAMGPWDHWSENGSPGAIALPNARCKPSTGTLDPMRSNVALNGDDPLMENTQRPMVKDGFGILEIFVYASGFDKLRVVDETGYRMRLDNVGPKVRHEFRTMGRVANVPVNKIVHLCSDKKRGARVDPPTTIASLLITADGYVRASNWSELQRVHFEPKEGPVWDPTGFKDCMDSVMRGDESPECHLDRMAMRKEISAVAAAAQELPLTWLEA